MKEVNDAVDGSIVSDTVSEQAVQQSNKILQKNKEVKTKEWNRKLVFSHGKKLRESYYKNHKRSIDQKEAFFEEQAKLLLSFSKDFTKTLISSETTPITYSWFQDGEINACYNAVDRHAESMPSKVAIIYEDNEEKSSTLTYLELKKEIVRAANYLINSGIKKNDCVCIYLPMHPKALIYSLACARIGAIHLVVFGGFSAASVALRIKDAGAKWIISTDTAKRGIKTINYLSTVAEIVEILTAKPNTNSNPLKGILLFDTQEQTKTSSEIHKLSQRVKLDLFSSITWSAPELNSKCLCVPVKGDSTLFYLYTSGSTGKPKGVSHSTAGYLLYSALTALVCFDLKEEDIFLCTAELGWITGHSYVMYAPLVLGITTVVYGGIPTYPNAFRLFRSIEAHKVTHLYTAPTLIRSLQKLLPDHLVRSIRPNECTDTDTPAVDHVPDSPVSSRSIFSHSITDVFEGSNYFKEAPKDSEAVTRDISSLRVLGSVGEPINKGAYVWLSVFFGKSKLPLIDTYWQTEAGGVMLSPLPGVTLPRPESASFPFFGMDPRILKKNSSNSSSNSNTNNNSNSTPPEEAGPGELGVLMFKGVWPGLATTIVGNHSRYESAYFPYKGFFYTGDEAQRDTLGYFWVGGRVDDVINVSGHRLSTAEIESAVCTVRGISEAAALAQEDEVTGQCICIFYVSLPNKTEKEKEKYNSSITESTAALIRQALRKRIGAVVSPKRVIECSSLPKTSTGKIMRRVLRKILEGQPVGDISTCMNPEAITQAQNEVAAQKQGKK